jgi:hypothetical protein
MVRDYEIRVAGPIGPVVASSLPGLTVTALPTSTVISGTVTDTEELLAVMNLLSEHGLTPIDTLITPHDLGDRTVPPSEQDDQHRSPDTP